MSRRSDIPTGASWQVGAHLRQRAGWRVRCPVDCQRGTGALRPSGAPAAASRRRPGSRRLFDVGARTRGRSPAHRSARRHHAPCARDAGRRRTGSAIGRTLAALHAQTSGRWSLTAVAAEGRLRDVGTALRASTPRRSRRRVRTIAAPGAGPTSSGRAWPPTRGRRGSGLPRGCLGTRRGGPPERGPHADRGRLRRRGPGGARRQPRRAAPQARLLAGVPPLLSVRRTSLAIGAGLTGTLPTSTRRVPPSWSTRAPSPPARRRPR